LVLRRSTRPVKEQEAALVDVLLVARIGCARYSEKVSAEGKFISVIKSTRKLIIDDDNVYED
jgi:hypothetical protein